jgi:hypothetical protein
MKPVEIQIPSSQAQCPHCRASMQLVRHIDLKGMPNIYIYYCNSCQRVETVKEERAARRACVHLTVNQGDLCHSECERRICPHDAPNQ